MRTRKVLAVAALLGVLSIAAGCSSENSSSTTTRTTYASSSESQQAPQPAATTTTTTNTSSEPDSVLGATFHLVGTIILLPFRVIGLIV